MWKAIGALGCAALLSACSGAFDTAPDSVEAGDSSVTAVAEASEPATEALDPEAAYITGALAACLAFVDGTADAPAQLEAEGWTMGPEEELSRRTRVALTYPLGDGRRLRAAFDTDRESGDVFSCFLDEANFGTLAALRAGELGPEAQAEYLTQARTAYDRMVVLAAGVWGPSDEIETAPEGENTIFCPPGQNDDVYFANVGISESGRRAGAVRAIAYAGFTGAYCGLDGN